VIQVYEGLVYMDFAKERMRDRLGLACGVYEPLEVALLPPLYIAYSTERSKPTERFHNDLRARYNAGEPTVLQAMGQFAGYAATARDALLARDVAAFGRAIDENFDLRAAICCLPPSLVEMIQRARRAGATAGFTGSGGAIVGTYPDQATFCRLQTELEAIECRVIRPQTER
jgi:glucuronokinase